VRELVVQVPVDPLSHRLAYSWDLAQFSDARMFYSAPASEVAEQGLDLLRPKPINLF